jgi:hypothetical protein
MCWWAPLGGEGRLQNASRTFQWLQKVGGVCGCCIWAGLAAWPMGLMPITLIFKTILTKDIHGQEKNANLGLQLLWLRSFAIYNVNFVKMGCQT